MELRTELARVERLVAALSRDAKAAEKTLKHERRDVDAARVPVRRSLWSEGEPDPDLIEQEIADVGHAEAELSIATELVGIVRARAETLRVRIAGGATTSEDTSALAYELRQLMIAVDAAAADAHSKAIHAAIGGGGVAEASFLHARRELARARVQLALVMAGADDVTTSRLAAIDLNITARAPDERWRREVAARSAELVEALAPLLPASAYR